MSDITNPELGPPEGLRNQEEGAPGPSLLHGLPASLAQAMERYADRLEVDRIRRACELAAQEAVGTVDSPGEEGVGHGGPVAALLARHGADTACLVSALIHGAAKGGVLTPAHAEEQFGLEVRQILEGLVEIARANVQSTGHQRVEDYRDLVLSLDQGPRAALVMLGERLHAMRMLGPLTPEAGLELATGTRSLQAPLARRLGMGAMEGELEELAFQALEPEAYEALRTKARELGDDGKGKSREMRQALMDELGRAGIPAEAWEAPEPLWAIHQRMIGQGRPFNEVYALGPIRVVTGSEFDCYATLGVIHSNWVPIAEFFHDYVATPLLYGYRSLHTTVVGPAQRRYEIRISSEEMYLAGEYGITAPWVVAPALPPSPG